MINGHIEQFLDTGWYSEASIYYNGYIYWCESDTDFETKITKFFVYRWKAEMDKDMLYHSYCKSNGEYVGYEKIFEISNKDMDMIKKQFLEANIFEGKSFWNIESKLAWLDEGTEIVV
jgi:ferritin